MIVCFRVSLLASTTIALLHVISVAEAQPCTVGFPSTVSQCTSGCGTRESSTMNAIRTRIILDMTFTCTGTVVKWRATGVFDDGSNNAKLDIWRETSSGSGTYNKVATIELGTCGSGVQATSVAGMSNVYECTLPESLRVSVQPGDVVGIEIARRSDDNFKLYFIDTNDGPTNYVFTGKLITVTLSDSTSQDQPQDQPQISLTVEMAAQTTEASTTTQLPTTTIASTTELTTVADTTQGGAEVPTTVAIESTTSVENIATTASTTVESANVPTTSEVILTTTGVIPTTSDEQTLGETTEQVQSTTDSPTTMGNPATSDAPAMTESDTLYTTEASTDTNVDGASGNNDSGVGATIAGASVGGIIAILLVVLIILLPFLVLRRRREGQKIKYSPNDTNIVNPIYDDNIAVQMPHNGPGLPGVYSMVNCDHAPTDYEDIDVDVKPSLPSFDMLDNSMHDYSKTPHPLEMSCYEIPLATLNKGMSLQNSCGNYDGGALYVPSQEQRKNLSNVNNEGIYSAIGMSQYSDSGPTPMLFEEDDTYWVPASDSTELFTQLSSKKYREIIRQQIQITSHLGAGQFGTVNRGIWQSPMGALDVAVKQLQSGASEEEKVKFLQEAAINGQFRHPNVVKLMGVVTVGEPTMIVLELLSNGDLHNYLIKLQPSPGEILPSNTQQLLLKFCQQVASGMEYLARKAFVHRDLAARNILVSEDKTCKISDFGMSRDLMDENYYVSHGGKVPVKWTAPEAIHFKKYSTASDVWSFGCVMYEIWSLGHKPFEAYRNPEVIHMADHGCRLPPPPGLPKELYKMMIQCWHGDRSLRPMFPQLVEMLSRADFELFVWEEEDLISSDPQVKVIGAPLEVAKNLYPGLQRSYLNTLSS